MISASLNQAKYIDVMSVKQPSVTVTTLHSTPHCFFFTSKWVITSLCDNDVLANPSTILLNRDRQILLGWSTQGWLWSHPRQFDLSSGTWLRYCSVPHPPQSQEQGLHEGWRRHLSPHHGGYKTKQNKKKHYIPVHEDKYLIIHSNQQNIYILSNQPKKNKLSLTLYTCTQWYVFLVRCFSSDCGPEPDGSA